MAQTFPNIVKDINLHIQEAQWTPGNDLTQLWNNNTQMMWGNGGGGDANVGGLSGGAHREVQ